MLARRSGFYLLVGSPDKDGGRTRGRKDKRMDAKKEWTEDEFPRVALSYSLIFAMTKLTEFVRRYNV